LVAGRARVNNQSVVLREARTFPCSTTRPASTGQKEDAQVTISEPTRETQGICKAFLLTALRTAVLRCDLDRNEIISIGTALKNDWISPECAISWLMDIGLIDQVIADEVRS